MAACKLKSTRLRYAGSACDATPPRLASDGSRGREKCHILLTLTSHRGHRSRSLRRKGRERTHSTSARAVAWHSAERWASTISPHRNQSRLNQKVLRTSRLSRQHLGWLRPTRSQRPPRNWSASIPYHASTSCRRRRPT